MPYAIESNSASEPGDSGAPSWTDIPGLGAGVVLRLADLPDIPALVSLENQAFLTDRLTRRNFHHILTRAHAACLVAERQGHLIGYALLFFRRGTSLARLYSIAVDPDLRGQGLGAALLLAAERRALAEGCWVLRLEVRADNEAAIALYRRRGYRAFGRHLRYYEDAADALRFEKRLTPAPAAPECRVPYYPQTTDFTCGPAAAMMALAALKPGTPLSPRLELRLWRESTTVFMTAGTGGCDPYGLALALHRRGLAVRLYVVPAGYLFLDSVRSEAKRNVMRLVQDDYMAETEAAGLPVEHRALPPGELATHLDGGAIVLALISQFRMYRERVPHWLVVHGHDARSVHAHDPWIETDDMESQMAKANLPIPWAEFDRMTRYGRSPLRAAIVVGPPAGPARTGEAAAS